MRILLTNDDGIAAPGIAALYRAIKNMGEIHVVAPATVQSATSHAATFHKPVPTWPETITCAVTNETFQGHSVQGRPADCVKLGLSQLASNPIDLVISGMNRGANVGINTIYSGTVAAAREAAFIGVPAIAVSLHFNDPQKIQWEVAGRQARSVIDRIVSHDLQNHTLLNVNIPCTDNGAEPLGVRVAPVSISPLVESYDITTDSSGRTHYRSKDDFSFQDIPAETDVHHLFERYITVTPMHFDLTAHDQIDIWAQHLQDDGPRVETNDACNFAKEDQRP